MPKILKLTIAVPFIALIAGCQAGANNRVDTVGEIEATTDTTISGDTVPGNAGAQVQP